MTVRFFWDFYGPNAEKTARHFVEHLGEFLAKHGLTLSSGCASGDDESHWFAYCDPPDVPQGLLPPSSGAPGAESVADQIGRALRPQRVEASEALTE